MVRRGPGHRAGGGRYRAVGRVVLGARMSVAYEVLRDAVQALDGESTNTEFSRLCLQLTGNGEASAPLQTHWKYCGGRVL